MGLTAREVEDLEHQYDMALNDVVYLAAENERLRDAIDKAITFLVEDVPGVAYVALRQALA